MDGVYRIPYQTTGKYIFNGGIIMMMEIKSSRLSRETYWNVALLSPRWSKSNQPLVHFIRDWFFNGSFGKIF